MVKISKTKHITKKGVVKKNPKKRATKPKAIYDFVKYQGDGNFGFYYREEWVDTLYMEDYLLEQIRKWGDARKFNYGNNWYGEWEDEEYVIYNNDGDEVNRYYTDDLVDMWAKEAKYKKVPRLPNQYQDYGEWYTY